MTSPSSRRPSGWRRSRFFTTGRMGRSDPAGSREPRLRAASRASYGLECDPLSDRDLPCGPTPAVALRPVLTIIPSGQRQPNIPRTRVLPVPPGCVKFRHRANQRDLDRHPYRAAASSLSPAADQPRRQSCECCPDNSRHRTNRRCSVVPDHLAVARCCDDWGAVDLMASISSLPFRIRARTHLVATCCLRIVACRIMLGFWWNVAVPDRSHIRADLSDICDRRDVRRHGRIERVAFTHPSCLFALGKPADGGPLLCRRHLCR